jgi:hypothetical protein
MPVNKEKRELYLLQKYRYSNAGDAIRSMINFIGNDNIHNVSMNIDIIDLALFRIQLDEFMEHYVIVKRFSTLRQKLGGGLSFICSSIYDEDAYYLINNHKFYTLDEVEKCLNNKSFL